MLKMIFIQLWNRKRNNLWILVELLLVFCLVWYMVDYFFVLGYNESLPMSRDISHTWQVNVKELPENHPDYKPAESDSAALEANYARVLDRLRNFDGVEAVGVLEIYSSPNSGSYMGSGYRNKTDTLKEAWGQIVNFDPREDFFRVFNYRYPDGKPVSVEDFDWADPNAMVICKQSSDLLFGNEGGIGKEVGYEEETRVIKGVVGDIKRFSYMRPQCTFYLPMKMDADNLEDMEISIRSSDMYADAVFLRKFKEKMYDELRIGNFYLQSIKSYKQIEKETSASFGQTGNVRIYSALLLFFLLNILLCVMGTFWYRIRVRREEVGLRMAMGATQQGILRQFFVEGLCLLAIITIPAMLIEMQFVYAGMIDTLGQEGKNLAFLPDRTVVRFLLTNCITWLVLACMILLAIWIPAKRASRMVPADALHYE